MITIRYTISYIFFLLPLTTNKSCCSRNTYAKFKVIRTIGFYFKAFWNGNFDSNCPVFLRTISAAREQNHTITFFTHYSQTKSTMQTRRYHLERPIYLVLYPRIKWLEKYVTHGVIDIIYLFWKTLLNGQKQITGNYKSSDPQKEQSTKQNKSRCTRFVAVKKFFLSDESPKCEWRQYGTGKLADKKCSCSATGDSFFVGAISHTWVMVQPFECNLSEKW